jgi:putative redox protein
MRVSVKRTNDNYRMEATNENGNLIVMDASKNIGGEESGFRPTQLLLAAVGGCTAIDVIMILKKQRQEIESFEVEVDGEKEKIEEYSLFRNIVLHYKLKGKIDRDKAERAIQLSLDKYCSVSKTLEPTAKITFRLSLND